MKKICILPLTQKKFSDVKLEPSDAQLNFEDYYGFQNAKNAIHYLMVEYNITRADEIYIDTTSNLNYVASCVTCTLFNYGKPSRELTDKTKMIYVIHEFGFVNKNIDKLIVEAKNRKVPLVEDVAHSFDSFYRGKRLGEIGDYGIYSMPKTFPVQEGGILRTKQHINARNNFFEKGIHNQIIKSLKKESVYLKSITKKRRSLYKFMQENIKDKKDLYKLDKHTSPFLYAFYTDKADRIIQKTNADFEFCIEFFPLHSKNIVGISCNSFIMQKDIQNLIKKINNI